MQTWDLAIRYLYLLRRWWALVLFAGFTSGAIAFYLLRTEPPQYVARTTLMVGTNLRSPNPPQYASGISMSLAAFYSEMVKRTPIIIPVIEKLTLPMSADVLSNYMVSTRIVPQAQLIEITVLDSNAERATQIANALAEELINFSPTSPEKIEEQWEFAQSQVHELEEKIKRHDERIQELNVQLQSMTSAGEIGEAQQRLRELETLKSGDQATYNGLLSNLNDSIINTLSIFEPATIPEAALPKRIAPAVLVAILLGLGIGLLAAWVLDENDGTWRTGRKPELLLGQRMLGSVEPALTGMLNNASPHGPRARESIALCNEILTGIVASGRNSILITSALPSRERSRLSIDVARLFAHSGHNSLLIDANMNEDFIADTFGIEGAGLQRLLREPGASIEMLAHVTEQPRLSLLPGKGDGNYTHLAPARRWTQVVTAAEQAAEVTIFDGPTILKSADATLLAPQVGAVILVIDQSTEKLPDTRRAVRQLEAAGAPLLGVVLVAAPKTRVWPKLQQYLRVRTPRDVRSAIS